MTEVAMGGPGTPPPSGGAPVPTKKEALAALLRYRELPRPEDNDLVQRWVAAAKNDPEEYARRIGLTK